MEVKLRARMCGRCVCLKRKEELEKRAKVERESHAIGKSDTFLGWCKYGVISRNMPWRFRINYNGAIVNFTDYCAHSRINFDTVSYYI